ncbi:MAG: hypothetical protein C0392_12965 [Syntrophus sp. (in: bacteria)]|nr:hypothetical protein [Syntrophus sp. (in: bacteria)]
MKRLICVLCMLFVGVSTYVFAETMKTISEKNEYGGETIMLTYSPGDGEYKKGTAKDITYLNGNKKQMKIESFFTEEAARKQGTAKEIAYLNTNEKPTKVESYYTNERIKKDGIVKSVEYYDSKGKTAKVELYDKKGKLRLTK